LLVEAAGKEEAKKATFYDSIQKSADLNDNLQELTDYIHLHAEVTGVYIGKLVYPAKAIDDDADDKAHIDEEAPKVI